MSPMRFPETFLWGAATSAHQVEGNNLHSDWWAWEQAGRVKEPSGLACDHYRRFREDFDLAKALGHNAHRFSVEWSRIEPREGEWDEEAIAHYQEVVRALRQRGLEPIVTLHHYTNPLWLAAQGGWTNPKVVERFARYARQVAETLGDGVRYWLTINEPMVYLVMHYLDGVGPPGEHNLQHAFQVMEHLVRAHAAAYHAIHTASRARGQQVMVSLAKHVAPFVPCRPLWLGDRLIAALTQRFYNHHFLDAVMEGCLRVPGRRAIRIPEARDTLDFIGMNYYFRQFIRLRPQARQWWGLRCDPAHHRQMTERNFLGWEVYPPGIAEVIRWARPYRRPVMVTENGICATDDRQRERFILRHLEWVRRAMDEGVAVLGYLYWSLLDNFEWSHGYAPRFGLVEVDYATQQRRVRESGRRFAQVCRTNRVGQDAVEG